MRVRDRDPPVSCIGTLNRWRDKVAGASREGAPGVKGSSHLGTALKRTWPQAGVHSPWTSPVPGRARQAPPAAGGAGRTRAAVGPWRRETSSPAASRAVCGALRAWPLSATAVTNPRWAGVPQPIAAAGLSRAWLPPVSPPLPSSPLPPLPPSTPSPPLLFPAPLPGTASCPEVAQLLGSKPSMHSAFLSSGLKGWREFK